MLEVILLSNSATSSAERTDVMLSAVDSVSFFASYLALYISLILSLRNLMDASSATLCAPLWELATEPEDLWFLVHLVRKVRWLV